MNIISITQANENVDNAPSGLLRFITAGSVDDGKSTLIGRLLHDTNNVATDQLEAVRAHSQQRGLTELDLSLLTDGLQAEREQGITIDVAYRYFSTERRKFIIGDSPGHEQYTRNMVTAASSADLAILLVDARKGVITQTRRHAYLAHLLGIQEWVLAINKMDLVDWDESVYRQIVDDFNAFAGQLGEPKIQAIPLSALSGDNVVRESAAMPWYQGPALLRHLEQVPARWQSSPSALRLPVQRVVRIMLGNGAKQSASGIDAEFRGYQGSLASGTLQEGDRIMALPSGRTAKVRRLQSAGSKRRSAKGQSAVVITLDDELDISRGDMLVAPDHPPRVVKEIVADICWLADEPLHPRRKYLIKHTTRTVNALFAELQYRIEINTLVSEPHPETATMNDILQVRIKLQQPLFVDSYADNRVTGSFIVIDPSTHATVAGGVIVS